MMRFFRKEHGLTMLELMIALTLFAILSPLVSVIIIRSLEGVNRQNDRQDRLAAFTTASKIFTDYLPLSQKPLLGAWDDRIEFVTSGTEGPRYVMIWTDCSKNELRYVVSRPHLNKARNPSFEEAFLTTTAQSQAQGDPSYVYGEDDIHYSPANTPPGTNPRWNPSHPWGWRGEVQGRQTTASTEVNPVRTPLLRRVSKQNSAMPGSFSMRIYQPNYRNDPSTEAAAGALPSHFAGSPPYSAGTTTASNRNSYTWSKSEYYAASQGDVFMVGGYMVDNSPALGNGLASQRPADGKLTRPRIEWYWVRMNGGEPELIQERSGAIVDSISNPSNGSNFQFKITKPAPQGVDGIVLRLSPGLLTRDDSADFDGITVQRVNGRQKLVAETGRTLYFDGAAIAPTNTYYEMPNHSQNNTAPATGWAGTAHRSVSYYGLRPYHLTYKQGVPAANPSQSSVLVKTQEELCTSGSKAFSYYDKSGTEITNIANRLSGTERITLNLRIFPNSEDHLNVVLNGLHNARTASEPTVGADSRTAHNLGAMQ